MSERALKESWLARASFASSVQFSFFGLTGFTLCQHNNNNNLFKLAATFQPQS